MRQIPDCILQIAKATFTLIQLTVSLLNLTRNLRLLIIIIVTRELRHVTMHLRNLHKLSWIDYRGEIMFIVPSGPKLIKSNEFNTIECQNCVDTNVQGAFD